MMLNLDKMTVEKVMVMMIIIVMVMIMGSADDFHEN